MKKILTKDNSITFYNPDFKELLHPESGAFKSINQRYLNHIKLKDNMKVLDIGYGIGYISLMILNRVKADITALEYNKECIKNSLILHPKLKTVKILASLSTIQISKSFWMQKLFEIWIVESDAIVFCKDFFHIKKTPRLGRKTLKFRLDYFCLLFY